MSNPITFILRDAHRLRKHLRDLQSEIDLGPRVLKIQQQKLADAQQSHKDAFEIIKKLKMKLKDDEITLKQTESQLAKFQMDINNASSKKEFDLKTTEIANATTKKGEYEDIILNSIMEIEDRTAKLPDGEKQWANAQQEFEQFKRDAQERLDRLLADQKETLATLVEKDSHIPPTVKIIYDRLVKSYGPDGLAAVNGRSCMQCRTSITDQQRTNLLGGTFFTCPQCGRGLYLAE